MRTKLILTGLTTLVLGLAIGLAIGWWNGRQWADLRAIDNAYSMGYRTGISDSMIPNAEFVDVSTGKRWKVVEAD